MSRERSSLPPSSHQEREQLYTYTYLAGGDHDARATLLLEVAYCLASEANQQIPVTCMFDFMVLTASGSVVLLFGGVCGCIWL